MIKPRPSLRLASARIVACCWLLAPSIALAASLPARKPGLWQITTRTQGVPDFGPVQQGVGPDSDQLMLEKARKKNCRVLDLKPAGKRVTVHLVCTLDGSTATSDGVLEGAFDAHYTGTLRTRFSPPWHGMSETTTTHEGRWLGPCKPGQKPGEVIGPNIGGVDVNALIKDPQVQEFMKRFQHR